MRSVTGSPPQQKVQSTKTSILLVVDDCLSGE